MGEDVASIQSCEPTCRGRRIVFILPDGSEVQ